MVRLAKFIAEDSEKESIINTEGEEEEDQSTYTEGDD